MPFQPYLVDAENSQRCIKLDLYISEIAHDLLCHWLSCCDEGHPISSDNETKPISLGRVSIILTHSLEYRELNHHVNFFHVAITMVARQLKNTG